MWELSNFLPLISALLINISVINVTLVNQGLTEKYIYISSLINLLKHTKIHIFYHRSQ